MVSKRRLEIVVETSRQVIIRRRSDTGHGFGGSGGEREYEEVGLRNALRPEERERGFEATGDLPIQHLDTMTFINGQRLFPQMGQRLCFDQVGAVGNNIDGSLPQLDELRPQPPRQPVTSGCRPSSGGRRGRAWEIGAEAFDALLARLDSDRERAGRQYLLLRQKLAKFFECRGCHCPAELADETINRVARRLQAGEEIRATEPARYFYGVGRNVLHEYRESRERQFISLEALRQTEHPGIDPEQHTERARRRRELELDCLSLCLRELPPESRNLLFDYYSNDKPHRIERRKRMAESLGITGNALKIRVHRLRATLGQRISEMLNDAPEA